MVNSNCGALERNKTVFEFVLDTGANAKSGLKRVTSARLPPYVWLELRHSEARPEMESAADFQGAAFWLNSPTCAVFFARVRLLRGELNGSGRSVAW